MSSVDQAAFAERYEARLRRSRNIEALAAALFDGLRPVVPFGFACLATTDPLTGVITWAYKSHPLPIGDEEFAAAEYGEPDVNQFADIARRPVPVGVLSHDTDGRTETCRRFRDFMVPQFGFTDEARVSLGVRGLTWGALALYRGAGEPGFSTQDAALLGAVSERIALAVRDTLFSGRTPPDARVPEPAVLVVDGEGRPRQMTRAARDRIEELGGWDHGSLPAGVLALAAAARGIDGVAVSRTSVGGRWLTLRAATMEEPESTPEGIEDDEKHGVVVTIDVAGPAELTGLTLIGRGLTAREQEIATLVVKGASTKAIAATLHLSPHTVQDHLKAVFAKLGINSRRELIGQLYG